MDVTVNLQLKSDAIAEDGTFEGLAAVYGNLDNQGDRIEPGAFAADHGREVPILWAHKRDEVAGVGTLEDGPDGLRIKGRFLLDTRAGAEAYARAKAGAARGLSVGFKLLKHAMAGAVRLIQSGSVAEVSLTSFPANRLALVTAVKSESPRNAMARYLSTILP